MEDLAQRFGDDVQRALQATGRIARETAFATVLERIHRLPLRRGDGESRDGPIRPNQIFAVSLFHSMLSREKATAWWRRSSSIC